MFDQLFARRCEQCIVIHPIYTQDVTNQLAQLDECTRQWLLLNKFKAKTGQYCLIPATEGKLAAVYVGMKDADDGWALGSLAKALPEGDYQLDIQHFNNQQCQRFFLAWGLGGYTFDRYKKSEHTLARLCLCDQVDAKKLEHMLQSFYLARDLINTPALDLRPQRYAALVKETVEAFGATYTITLGDELVKKFPGVHAVGQAGEQPPCLIDITWGKEQHPKLTLVGKGVCFDSGGLDLKSAAGMLQMKKDMGGSAIALAIARLIMAQQLPVRLRLILPLVENAVSGNSYRPGDILTMRTGKTVEIGNTDAEGRIILADALALASEEKPNFMIDFATLTGAARIAMGPDIPALFSNNDDFAAELQSSSVMVHEVIGRLPLYQPYREFLESPIADLNNVSSTTYGGSITAALFLREFIDNDIPWAHFDVMAANTRDLPGRPQGGEASALATVYDWIERKFVATQ